MTNEDCFIYFADDEVLSSELGRQQLEAAKFAISLASHQSPGAFSENELLHFNLSMSPKESVEIPVSELSIQGPHNLVNAMAASLAALLCEVPLDKLVNALGTFENVAHRLEYIGELGRSDVYKRLQSDQCRCIFLCTSKFRKTHSVDCGWR